MSNPINAVRKRRALSQRKEPYWASIRRGAAVGLYVGTTTREWSARAKDPTGTYRYRTLGAEAALTYEEAEAAAREFADLTARATKPNYTVADAVADYVADARARNGEASARGIEQRLRLHISPEFGSKRVADLRSVEVKRWRDALVRVSANGEAIRQSQDNANRLLAMFKAALNLAFRSGLTASDGEWRRVPAFRDVAAARTLFLEPAQVAALLRVTSGAFHDLVHAAILTGARYGELAAARVRDFDPRAGTLRLDGKTGPRTAFLSGEAVQFFRGLARDKLPDAYLLARDDGTPWGKSHQHRPMQAAVKAAELPPESVFYSLRHYYISRALLAGVPMQVVAENVGTSIRMIEKHYGKFLASDRRRLLDQVAL